MVAHSLAPADRSFRARVESCEIAPSAFDHRAHVTLAYVYLAEQDTERAYELMRDTLLTFLDHHGVERSKYHDTLTRAWIMAVRHFMERSSRAESADAFIAANPSLLDSKIMMTHYSAELLFSDEARQRFVEPDLDPIPRQTSKQGNSTERKES